MVTITPPPVAPTSGPTSGSVPVITIPTPPPVLAQLPTGLIFDAQYVRPDGAPPQLQTPFGPVNVRLPFPLPPASLLQVEVTQLTPQLQLRIIALDGQQLPQQGSTQTRDAGQSLRHPASQQSGSTNQSTIPPSAGTAAGNRPVNGLQLAAQQLSAVATGGTTPAIPAVSIDVGANLSGVVLRSPAHDSGNRPQQGHTQNAMVPQTQPATPSTGPTTPAAAGAQSQGINPALQGSSDYGIGPQLTEGAQLLAKIVQLGANPISQTSTPTANGNQVVSARIVASTPAGQSVIDLQGSLVALNTAQPLPSGEILSLEINQLTPPPSGKVAINQLVGHVFHHREWPLLNSSMAELREAAPATSHQFFNTVVPRANAQLTTNILLFLNILGGGNFRGWIGNTASRLLDAERPGLMNQLDDEFSRLSRSYNDTAGSEWRTALLPFFTGSELEQVRFHTRGQGDEEGENEDEPKRFLIDIELSELGRIQLDGLVRGKNKRFDLFFRTDQLVTAEMRRDINRIFIDFVEASGVKGSIIFQANGEFVDVPSPADGSSIPYGWTA